MRISCWTPEATNTQLEHTILIHFLLQQWSHLGASMLRCTYIASLLSSYLLQKDMKWGFESCLNNLRHCLDITVTAVASTPIGKNFVTPLTVFVRPKLRKRKLPYPKVLHYMAQVLLDTNFSLRRFGLYPRPIYVGFMANKVALV